MTAFISFYELERLHPVNDKRRSRWHPCTITGLQSKVQWAQGFTFPSGGIPWFSTYHNETEMPVVWQPGCSRYTPPSRNHHVQDRDQILAYLQHRNSISHYLLGPKASGGARVRGKKGLSWLRKKSNQAVTKGWNTARQEPIRGVLALLKSTQSIH